MLIFRVRTKKNKIKFVIWLLLLLLLLLLLRGLLSWLLFVRNDFLVVVVVILDDDDGACETILDLPILLKLVFVVELVKLLFGGKILSGVTFVVLLEELVPCVRWLDGVDVVWMGVVLALEELVVPVVVGVFVCFGLSIETKGEMRRDWFDVAGPRGFCDWVVIGFGSILGKSLMVDESLFLWLEFLLDFSTSLSTPFWSYNLNAPLSFYLNEKKIKAQQHKNLWILFWYFKTLGIS